MAKESKGIPHPIGGTGGAEQRRKTLAFLRHATRLSAVGQGGAVLRAIVLNLLHDHKVPNRIWSLICSLVSPLCLLSAEGVIWQESN
jgi:hypothetical protein